ncbi:MAG: cytochrome c, partial [Verrucomicrobiales bacterium]|nr:cytochrome c [Verrucomicrobiales bacterium]
KTLCTNCHGADGVNAPLPTARAFGNGELKFGADPYSMFQTLTKGNGLMGPQTSMSPKERYQVIYYIRETFISAIPSESRLLMLRQRSINDGSVSNTSSSEFSTGRLPISTHFKSC